MLKRGFYKHYKGGLYYVLTTGVHTETNEDLVVYYSLHFFSLWIRPLAMFQEWVTLEERPGYRKTAPRFRKISVFEALGLLFRKPNKS